MGDAGTLAELRAEIDRLDAAMHALLIERSAVIDRLVATKGTARSGSAFRPDREAAMMRALAARHEGRLPLDAPEAIWRIIISTFTHVQAPFAVHGDVSVGAGAMRDAARFHFGFTVPYREHPDPAAVVAAVAAARGDLGLVGVGTREVPDSWWEALEAPGAPKIIARLPFLDRPDHPVGTPLLALARAPDAFASGAVRLHSARLRPGASDGEIAAAGWDVVARHGERALLAEAGADPADALPLATPPLPVGSHAEPFRAAAG